MTANKPTKERKQFEESFLPLYNFIHGKNQTFKEKQALFYNENKITIFKGDELVKFFIQHKDKVVQLHPKINDKPVTFEDEKDALYIARQYIHDLITPTISLMENKIIMRLERHPEDPGKRWPKRLALTKVLISGNFQKDQKFTEDSFFTWNLVVRSGKTNLQMLMILFAVFLAFLYPIWPFAFKYAGSTEYFDCIQVFKVTLYVSIVLLCFIVVRLLVYMVLRIFGISFWILPNLDDEALGFWGSLKPLHSFERNKDGKIEVFLRLVGLISLVLMVVAVSQEPTILVGISHQIYIYIYIIDIQDASSQTVDDLLDWGKTKLENKNMETLHKRAIPDLSDIIKENQELDEIIVNEHLDGIQNEDNGNNNDDQDREL